MKKIRTRVFVAGAAAMILGISAEIGFSWERQVDLKDPVNEAVARGLKWLISTQGKDGGWGQDGGETTYVRQGEHLESTGNDVANTAVVALAILHTGTTPVKGEYRLPLQRAVDFVLQHVEQSSDEGLAVTDLRGTQIQRKLGPYIDTFMTSKLLAELDGSMGDVRNNARVRKGLQKCVAKIEKNQLKDGSWNIAGGWAPILGTSMASQSLALAQSKGAANPKDALLRVEAYTVAAAPSVAPGVGGAGVGSGGGVGAGMAGGIAGSGEALAQGRDAFEAKGYWASRASSASAGVPLYQSAQTLEQLSRTPEDRAKNKAQIQQIAANLSNRQFVTGFGSIGGEEFFSWLNISDSLHRTGGPEWEKWSGEIRTKLVKLQNEDGTWAGHHCITGRVAVTSAAILLLRADREPVPVLSTSTTTTPAKPR